MKYKLIPGHYKNRSLQVTEGAAVVELTFGELCEKLAPPPVALHEKFLRDVATGDFVGLRRTKGKLVPFMVSPEGAGGRVDWLLSKDPGFAQEVVSVYKVLEIDRGGSVLPKR